MAPKKTLAKVLKLNNLRFNHLGASRIKARKRNTAKE